MSLADKGADNVLVPGAFVRGAHLERFRARRGLREVFHVRAAVRVRGYGEGMQTGDEVPDFELPDQTGTPRRLSTLLADGPVVLFFYPAAMTTGCTKEACHFRDLATEYRDAGVQRIGISVDDVVKQKQFADK